MVCKEFVGKRAESFPSESYRRELGALERCVGLPGLQQLRSTDPQRRMIWTEWGGEQLGEREVPDREEQARVILGSLKKAGVRHNDISPINLVMKDGKLTLIDFEWAIYEGSSEYCPPSLGGEYQASGS